MTDEFGQFTLIDVPPGLHELVAYKEGYPIYRAPMRVQEGRTYSLNLKLSPPGKKQKGKTTPEAIAGFSHALLGLIITPNTFASTGSLAVSTEFSSL